MPCDTTVREDDDVDDPGRGLLRNIWTYLLYNTFVCEIRWDCEGIVQMLHGTRRCCSEAVRRESAVWLSPPCDVWLIPHRCGNACVMYVADPAYVDTFHLETSRLCSSKIILSCQLLGHEMALAGGSMGKLLVLRVGVIDLPDVGNRTPDRKLRVSGSATSSSLNWRIALLIPTSVFPGLLSRPP